MSHSERVAKFMTLAGRKLPAKPTVPPSEVVRLCAKLVMEEFVELMAELGYKIPLESLPEPRFLVPHLPAVAKEACDLRYVVTYLMLSMGIDSDSCQVLVDTNNLDKFGPGHSFRGDGKLLPPPGFTKESLEGEIRRQTCR